MPYFHLADERCSEITTGQILAQVAGIPDSGAAMADWETFMPQYDGGAGALGAQRPGGEGCSLAPGEGWGTATWPMRLLVSVIEVASGQPYEAQHDRTLFRTARHGR